jgi:peptide/nickel transport system permease protein
VSEVAVAGGVGQEARVVGRSPWALAARRLLRNRIALVALAGFILIVVACLAAGWYAHSVAHTHPFESTIDGTTLINGKEQPVMVQGTGGLGLGVTPIGPTWDIHHYFLGADNQGRDVAARMLYGGRNSLIIGTVSAALCCFFATIIALIAGFFGGIVDQILSRILDVIWAFPVFLAAISISTVALTRGIPIGPITLNAGSLWLPIAIISVIYVPYVARPIRGQVLSIREKEFVEAARSLGASDARILFRHILPNLVAPIIVYTTLLIPTNILFEAALSFLGVGVQPPTASWGSMLADATDIFDTAWWFMTFPGLALLLTVLSFNLIGDGLQDALNPRTGR